MFHIYTSYPYANNQQCGVEDTWYTKENVVNNVNIYHHPSFNTWVYDYNNKKPLFVLEIGCGTGSIVQDFIQDGHLAIGLDGFYVYRKYLCGAWKDYPYNLFTCDLGEDFTICYNEYAKFDINNPCKFDIIYSTEFLEHLHYRQVDNCIVSINKHSHNDTLLILEISEKQDGGHLVVESKDWWINKFRQYDWSYNDGLTNSLRGNFLRNISSSNQLIFNK